MAVAAAAPFKEKLGELNDKSAPQSSPGRAFGIRGAAAVADSDSGSSSGGGGDGGASAGSSSSAASAAVPSAFSVAAQVPMPQPVHPLAHVPQAAVGTLMVGGVASTISADTGRKKVGQRGKDLKKRATRTCKVCTKASCPGTNNRKNCPQFKGT